MNKDFNEIVDMIIKVGLLVVLVLWCVSLLRPFLAIFLWAVIIAVTLAPSSKSLAAKFGGREKTSAVILTIAMLALLIFPTYMLGTIVLDGFEKYGHLAETEELKIPPPRDSVKDWPVIGERVYQGWDAASSNLEKTLTLHQDKVRELMRKGISFVGGFAGTLLMFILASVISGVLLTNQELGNSMASKVAQRLSPERGQELLDSTVLTIRNVTKGILGVALIQATLAGLGLFIMDVPGAPLLTIAVLILAIVQLGPGLVLIPASIWVFTTEVGVVWASVYLVYNIVVSVMDTALKPIFMGKGSSSPTLVIFLGAIGGLIMHGMIGLFVGAIVLVVSYELLVDWLNRKGYVEYE